MASIVFDCNRLYLPTQRKLNAAWREMEEGEQVCIVPTVAWELLDKLPCAFGELRPDVVAEFLQKHFIDSGKVRELTKIAIGSCWPLEIPASFDQVSRQVVGFCSACKGALLEETGRAVFEHWKGAEDIDALLGEISANLPLAMRQSESGHPSIMGYAQFAQERGVADAGGPHPS